LVEEIVLVAGRKVRSHPLRGQQIKERHVRTRNRDAADKRESLADCHQNRPSGARPDGRVIQRERAVAFRLRRVALIRNARLSPRRRGDR
jgi:hypothetical protein